MTFWSPKNSFESPSFEGLSSGVEGFGKIEVRHATESDIRSIADCQKRSRELYRDHNILISRLISLTEKELDDACIFVWPPKSTISSKSLEDMKAPSISEDPLPAIHPIQEDTAIQTERQSNIQTLESKEKLETYGQLSDIAYIEFSSDLTTVGWKESPKIDRIQLDPLELPHIRDIAMGKELKNPTPEESILLAFLENPDNHGDYQAEWTPPALSPDVDSIFRTFSLYRDHAPARLYANLDHKYQFPLPNPPVRDFPEINGYMANLWAVPESRMNRAIEHLRRIKTKTVTKNFEAITKKGFEVVDYFPNEHHPEDRKDGSSGFGAVFLRDKQGKYYFAIRGTEPTDWGDLSADFQLTMNRVPKSQSRDMIRFMDRNLKTIPSNQKIQIVGHSLGGALAQIAGVMYSDRLEEVVTFNAPGAKGLKVNLNGLEDQIRSKFEKFQSFWYTSENDPKKLSIKERMTHVKWTAGLSMISNLHEGIGNYEVGLTGLASHSVESLVQYIQEEATTKELQRKYVGPQRNVNKEKIMK